MVSKRLMLSPPERRELSRRLRSRSVRSEDARRAEVILRCARGQSVRVIAGALRCSTSYVQRWINRRGQPLRPQNQARGSLLRRRSWIGFEPRDAILEVLDEAIADRKAQVRVVAFDLCASRMSCRV